MDISCIYFSFVFVGWTITSYLCHFYAKLFITESSIVLPGYYCNILILTALQMLCFLLSSKCVNNTLETMDMSFLILIAHTCATLTTNWSIAVSFTASTFAIKLMEPLTSAVLQRVFLGIRLTCLHCLSIPLVVYGAIVFADESQQLGSNISRGSSLAFISNICLAFRNVLMKKIQLSNSVSSFDIIRSWLWLSGTCVIIGLFTYLFIIAETPFSKSLHLCGLVTISSIFHAVYTYLSTAIVLKNFSVVGHAFGNILKRLIVIYLLYVTGSRSATTWNFVGLCLCVIGLTIYTFSKVQTICGFNIETMFHTRSEDLKTYNLFTILVVGIAALVMTFALYNGTLKLFEESWKNNKRGPSLSKTMNFSFDEFLSTDLIEYPEEANKLSQILTSRTDVITEAQRIHMNIFTSLLGGYKYAMLFDYSQSENEGVSTKVVGEVTLLQKLNIKIISACPSGGCSEAELHMAQSMSKSYTDKELVIFLQSGGTIGFHHDDTSRFLQISYFMNYKIVVFPQSIDYKADESHMKLCKKMYSSHKRLTFLWRDTFSYNLGKKLFPKVQSLLSPDMTYQVGKLSRIMEPTQDILWVKRADTESLRYKVPETHPGNRSPKENTFLMTNNGLTFLQRGRVVITDQLHGHVLSTLLDIPHVCIDNKEHAISNYHKTWTAGLDNIVRTNSSIDALIQAKRLLLKLDNTLPQIKG